MLDRKRQERVTLADRLTAAEAKAAAAWQAARKAASNGGDDNALDKLEAAGRACADRVATLRGGLEDLDAAIAQLEADERDATDRQQRCEPPPICATGLIVSKPLATRWIKR